MQVIQQQATNILSMQRLGDWTDYFLINDDERQTDRNAPVRFEFFLVFHLQKVNGYIEIPGWCL